MKISQKTSTFFLLKNFVIFLIKHVFSYNIYFKSSDQERKTYIIARRVTEIANILGVVLKCELILIEEEITLKIKKMIVSTLTNLLLYIL